MAQRFHLFIICVLLTLVTAFFSLTKGSAQLSFRDLFFADNPIFLSLRLPRTLCAFISGGLLALAGCLMQLLLKNPLADPYALGISSGAALGTLLMILLGLNEDLLLIGAWAGSISVTALIVSLSSNHRFEVHALLLTGIALACGLSACISIVLLLSADTNLHTMLFWLSGDLNATHIPWFALGVLILGSGLSFLLAPSLNILGRSDKEAMALGISATKYRVLLFLLASLFTATAVTLSGCISFIGLIVPHFTRLLIGFDHRFVLPMATLLGGSLLMLADTFARTLIAPQQLPVGLLIAIIGVPFFIWLINHKG